MRNSSTHIRRSAVVSLITVVLVLSTALVVPRFTFGQNGDQPYEGLDLVILVDQSGSMGGLAYGSSDHPDSNDRNNLRFEAAKFIVDWLGSASLTYGADIKNDFRVALVDFGDTAETRLAPVTIDPGSDQEWENRLKELQQAVSAEEFGARNLGNTNHLLAFERAKQIFDTMDAEGLPGNRLRAIIMLTDGIPYVLQQPDPNQPPPSSDGETPSPAPVAPIPLDRYMSDLVQYVQQNFPPSEYKLFIVGMNDSDRDQWGPVVNYWNQITNNNAQLAENNEQAGATLQQYLEELRRTIGMGPGGFPAECGPYVVPPYLQLIKLNVHKASAEDNIGLRINGVDFDLQDRSKARVRGSNSVIETIEIPNPEPGFWDIVCPPNARLDPKIYSEQVQMVAQLLAPLGRQLQYVPAPIQLKLNGYSGSALPRYGDPKYRLDVQARVTQPSGETTIPLSLNNEGIYTAPYVPAEPGNYRIAIVATTQDPNGVSIELLNEDKGEFTVSTTRPRLLDAPATTVLVPSEVVVEIADDQGNRVEPEVFTNLGSQLALALDEPNGRRTFPLHAQQDGLLTASAVPLESGDHVIALTVTAPGTNTGTQPLDQPLGNLSVAPLTAQLEGMDDPQPQYGSVRLAVRLLDRNGKPVATSGNPAFDLAGTAMLTGVESGDVTLQSEGDGLWTSDIRPQTPGAVNVHAVFNTTGDTQTAVYDGAVGTFQVTPTTLVSLGILEPKNGEKQAYNGFLPFLKNPFGVRVELLGDGEPIDPAVVLADPAHPPFKITVSDSLGQDRSSELAVEPTGETGRWQALGERLTGRDTYLINVTGNAPLKPAFVWDEKPQSLSVVRIPNPILPLTYGIAGLIFLVLLFFAVAFINNHFLQAKATGVLTIVDSNDKIIGTPCNLDGRGVHSLKWAPNASLAGVKKVRVTGKKNGVKVKVTKTKGSAIQRDLVNGARTPLNPGFFLTYSDKRGGSTPGSINW